MKIGDVVLFDHSGSWFKPKKFFHNCIRTYNKYKYGYSVCTHAGIISSIKGDKVFIHEAISRKGKDFKAYEYDKWWLDMMIERGKVIIRSPIGVTKIRQHCGNYEHTFYDWLSIALMPFKLSVDSTELVFCSEVVARILYDASGKQLNISAELGKSYEKLSPMDLFITEQLK